MKYKFEINKNEKNAQKTFYLMLLKNKKQLFKKINKLMFSKNILTTYFVESLQRNN